MSEQPKFWQPFTNCFVYSIYLPRETVWSPEQAVRLMQGLLGSFPFCILRLAATSNRIFWQLLDWGSGYDEQQMSLTIRSAYPEAVIEKQLVTVWEKLYPLYRSVTVYDIEKNFMLPDSPLSFATDFRTHEPLMALTQAMNMLLNDEQIHVTLICSGQPKAQGALGVLASIGGKWMELQAAEGLEYKARRLVEEKFHAPHYFVCLSVQVESPNKERLAALEGLIQPILTEGFARLSPNAKLVRDKPMSGTDVHRIMSIEEDLHSSTVGLYDINVKGNLTLPPTAFHTLIPQEVAALWHLPHKDMTASRIFWIQPVQGELPEILVGKKEGASFGNGALKGREIPVFLPDRNRRTHMSVLGATGTGKSTFLHHLIHQDIAQGKGVAVIDPHGTLIDAILQHSIPPEREQDVVVIDLSQHDYPPPLNPFRGGGKYGNAGKILRAVEMASGTGNYARLKKFLQAAVQTVDVDPEATIRDLSRVFRDDKFRNDLQTKLDDPILDETWGDFDGYNLTTQEGVRDPVLSRINPFYGNRLLYPAFCHPHALDFAEHMRKRRIILISLKIDARTMGEDEEELIGAFLISHLYMAGLEQPENQKTLPFYIYIDEVERFAKGVLDNMLNEVRKHGVAVILAHQYLAQIKGDLLKSVMSNVNTRVVFRCSLDDAKEYTPYMGGEFDNEDVITLSNHQAIIKTDYSPNEDAPSLSLPAFGIRTLEPLPTPTDAAERAARIRASSIHNFTPMTAKEVKEWLDKRYPRKPRSGGEGDHYE